MSSWDGKWKRTSCENADAIIKELAQGDAGKTAALKAYYTEAEVIDEVSVTAAGTRRVTYINGEKKMDLDSEFGKEIERDTFLGKSKIFGTKVSDTKLTVKETGLAHPNSEYVFEIKDGKLYTTQTTNGVTCVRVSTKC